MTDEGQMNRLAAMVVNGDLSDTAFFAVVDERAEAWVDRELARLDEGLTLGYPEVAWLLLAIIATLFLAAVGVLVL